MSENFCIIKKTMTALELVSAYPHVFDAAIEQRNKELAQQTTNNRMLKCRFHNKGRGCPIGKVPCPEGHGCMLRIGTSAY